jgi:hypothetical protein
MKRFAWKSLFPEDDEEYMVKTLVKILLKIEFYTL